MDPKIKELTDRVKEKSELTAAIAAEVRKVIVGQDHLVEALLVSLLAGGHILLEGVPGLAKTLAIKTLARAIDVPFNRMQCTPDLLPADLVGTRVFDPRSVEFRTEKGPIFANFLLADEINRAPSKVQSALLEAMEEGQVTIEKETFRLTEPFLVLATQNPVETEGTYPLSEAQVDRFMFKIDVGYPNAEEEKRIVKRIAVEKPLKAEIPVNRVATAADILACRDLMNRIYVDDNVVDYAVRVVESTRDPGKYGLKLAPFIRFGASPRASLYLIVGARAKAFLRRRGFTTPEDVKAVAADVLRHRLMLTYEAEAEEIGGNEIVDQVLRAVPVP